MSLNLSGKYADISQGLWEDHYDTSFGALMALACHARRNDATEAQFIEAAWRAGLAADRKANSRVKGEKKAAEAFARATSVLDGAVDTNERFSEALAMWEMRIPESISGRGGASERLLLEVLTARAQAARTLQDLNASVRLLSAETLLAKNTITSALHRLQDKGLIRLRSEGKGLPQLVTLVTDGVSALDAANIEVVDHALPHEAFRRTGLRGHSAMVYSVLTGYSTVREVAEALGLTTATARATLHRLAAAGLVRRVDRYHWEALPVDLDEVAADPNRPGVPTAGLRERMTRAYEAERFHYQALLEERKVAGPSRDWTPPWILDLEAEILSARAVEAAVGEVASVADQPLSPDLNVEDLTLAESVFIQSGEVQRGVQWRTDLMLRWVKAHRGDDLMMAEGRRIGLLPPLRAELDARAAA